MKNDSYLLFVPGNGEPTRVLTSFDHAVKVAGIIADKADRNCYVLRVIGRAHPKQPTTITTDDIQRDITAHQ